MFQVGSFESREDTPIRWINIGAIFYSIPKDISWAPFGKFASSEQQGNLWICKKVKFIHCYLFCYLFCFLTLEFIWKIDAMGYDDWSWLPVQSYLIWDCLKSPKVVSDFRRLFWHIVPFWPISLWRVLSATAALLYFFIWLYALLFF